MVEQGLKWLEISESFQEELCKVKHTNDYVKVKSNLCMCNPLQNQWHEHSCLLTQVYDSFEKSPFSLVSLKVRNVVKSHISYIFSPIK